MQQNKNNFIVSINYNNIIQNNLSILQTILFHMIRKFIILYHHLHSQSAFQINIPCNNMNMTKTHKFIVK
ncbi:hypothetical protein pb186bvf_001499 [Paramecium bursaria]